MIFSSDGIESSLDLIANDKIDILTLTKLINWSNIKTINTAIIAFYRKFLKLDNNFIEPVKKYDDTYISGGYVEKEIKHFKPKKFDKQEIVFKKSQVESFQRCINYIHSKKIKTILVQAPISKSLYSSYVDIQFFNDTMLKYGEYYDFNKILQMDDSIYFADSHHLNKNGVKIFNEKLIDLLKNDIEKIRTYNSAHKSLGTSD